MQRQLLGENLRRSRQALRLSQTAVASQLGLSRQAVSAAESGKRAITVEELLKLSNLYRRPVEFFLKPHAPTSHEDVERVQRRENARRSEALDEHDRSEIASFIEVLREETRRDGEHWGRQVPRLADLTKEIQTPFRQLSKIADRVREIADLRTPPTNVYQALSCFGIRVRMTGLNTISGAFVPETKSRVPGVLINSNQPPDRQRYSAAHELGHYVLGHSGSRPEEIVSPLGRRFSSKEVEADAFASEFLMPADVVMHEIRRLSPADDIETRVYRIADRFLVSYQAMVYRLANINVITPSQKEMLLEIRPTDIEARLHLKERGRKHFDPVVLKEICGSSFPLHLLHGPDGVRQLQELAFEEYARQVSEAERADSAGGVYEKVAIWVSETYPLIMT